MINNTVTKNGSFELFFVTFKNCLLSINVSNGKEGWLWETNDDTFKYSRIFSISIVENETTIGLSVIILIVNIALAKRKTNDKH